MADEALAPTRLENRKKTSPASLPALQTVNAAYRHKHQQGLFGVSIERLEEIERTADGARNDAIERIGALYQSHIGSDSDEILWLVVQELTDAVTLLIGGQVDVAANLTVDGQRLAAGIRWQQEGWADILFEAYDPAVRQRFSLAHELGHFYLHEVQMLEQGGTHGDPPHMVDNGDGISNDDDDTAGFWGENTDGDNKIDPENPEWEREANAFAGAFLVPARRLEKDVRRFGKAAPFLAARYSVSSASMGRRIATLEALGRLNSSSGILTQASTLSSGTHSDIRQEREHVSEREAGT